MRTTESLDGLLVVDKPAGFTSHDAVAKCRKFLHQKRVGHSGTLDPDATGVLLVGVGRVTRLLRYLTALPKTYSGEVVLGSATTTLDASGEVLATFDMASVDTSAVRKAAGELTGDIEQVPPMVSARKVGGRRLHELAREGIEVEREPRSVTVYRFDVGDPIEPLVFPIKVECSSGTYIRTLAADLGEALGGGAHLRNLRRNAIGSFGEQDATTLDEIEKQAAGCLLSAAEAMRDYESVVADEEQRDALSHGRPIHVDHALAARAYAVVSGDGELLAVCDGPGPVLRPAVVIAAS